MTDLYDAMGTQLAERARLLAAEHGPFASPHEAYGVLAEEVAELLDEVRRRAHNGVRLRDEALDIAAAALRYAVQLGVVGDVLMVRVRAGQQVFASPHEVYSILCGEMAWLHRSVCGYQDHTSASEQWDASLDIASTALCYAVQLEAVWEERGERAADMCSCGHARREHANGAENTACLRPDTKVVGWYCVCAAFRPAKPEPMAKPSEDSATDDGRPRVGDVWVGDGEERGELVVTVVEAPPEQWDDWRVALAPVDQPTLGRGPTHRGWWYGQGWIEKDA